MSERPSQVLRRTFEVLNHEIERAERIDEFFFRVLMALESVEAGLCAEWLRADCTGKHLAPLIEVASKAIQTVGVDSLWLRVKAAKSVPPLTTKEAGADSTTNQPNEDEPETYQRPWWPKEQRIGVYDYASLVACLLVNFHEVFPDEDPRDPQNQIQRMTAEIQMLRRRRDE